MSIGALMAGAAFVKLSMDDSSLQQGLNRAQKSIGNFKEAINVAFSRMNIASTELAAIFTAINMPMVGAIKTFGAFDDRMRQVQAVTGATGDSFKSLTEDAKRLGAETAFTASQVSEGMLALGRMGLNPKEIEDAIKPMMNLSQVTGTELGQAAEIAANNMRVFGLEATKMTHVADILSVTANSSAQTLVDLGESLKMAGPHAKRAGADLMETSAALGILANMGIRGSLAGTALGKSYKRLADPKVMAYLKQYKIETLNVDGSMRKMRDTLVDIAKAMKTMTNAEQITFAEEVFDARGSLGGGTLSVNTDGIDQLLEKLKNSEGAAQRAADVMENGIGGTLRRLSSAAEGISLAFGEMLSVSFLPLIKMASKLCDTLRNVIKENAGILGGISQIIYTGLGLGAIVKVFFIIGGALKNMFQPLGMFINYLDKIVSGARAAENAQKAAAAAAAIATENAEKLKALATEKSNADRTVSETRRHYIEMQNAVRSAAMTVSAEKQKLEAVKAAAAQGTAIEAKKLSLTQTRCNLEMAAEEKKLRDLTAIRNAELANNEKAKLAYSLQNGSSSGFKNTPELALAEKNLAMQEKITATKVALAQKEITDQKKIIAIKTANYQKEVTTQEKLIQLKMTEQTLAQKNVSSAAASYSAARAGATSAASAQNALAASLDAVNSTATTATAQISKMFKTQGIAAIFSKTSSGVIASANLKTLATSLAAAKGATAVTASFYAQAVGAKVAAVVMTGLRAVMTTLAAHPVMIALLAVATALWAIDKAYTETNDSARKFSEEMKKQSDASDKKLKQGDNTRQNALAKFERLKQLEDLSKKTKLTAEEIAEAERLMTSLGQFGSSYWATLDKTYGKLKLNADAQAVFNKNMAENAKNQLKSDISNLKAEMSGLTSENEILLSDENHTRLATLTGRHKDAIKQLEENGNRIGSIMREIQDKKLRLKAMENGDQNAVTGQDGESTADKVEQEKQRRAAAVQELTAATQRLAELDEEAAKRKRSNVENEIADLKKVRDEYQKNIDLLLEEEKAKLSANVSDVNANAARTTQAQKDAFSKAVSAADENRKKISELESRLAAANADFDRQSEEARRKDADKQKPYADFLSNVDDEKRKRDINQQNDKDFSAAMERKNYDAAYALMETLFSIQKEALEKAKEKYQQLFDAAISETSPSGAGLSDSEISNLDTLRSEIKESMSRVESFQSKMDEARAAAIESGERSANISGSWQLADLANSLQNSAVDRTATATEKSAMLQEKANKKLDAIAKTSNTIVYG